MLTLSDRYEHLIYCRNLCRICHSKKSQNDAGQTGVGVLQVTYGSNTKYVSNQLFSGAVNGFTDNITAALCVRIPTPAEALVTPVFSITGALDGKCYGLSVTKPSRPVTSDGPTFDPTTGVFGYFTATSFTPTGATPEAVPPAFSQYSAALNSKPGKDWVESSIWSMSADAVPVLSPQWVNPADGGDCTDAAVQSPPSFVYQAGELYTMVSANPDLNTALGMPAGTLQMATLTFVQSPCLDATQ